MSKPIIIKVKRKRRYTIRNILPGRIMKDDRIISITFNRTAKNKWTQRNTKKFMKDYKINDFISNGSKINNRIVDVKRKNRRIIAITYPIRDKKMYKNFRTKKNKGKDIIVVIGSI